MQLVIHAGTNKTGTTSLQHSLAQGGAGLRAQGLLYPLLPWGRVDHNLLTTLLVPRESWTRGLRAAPSSIEQEAEALWSHVVASARAEPGAVTILSGEFLFEMAPEGWAALKARAEDAGFTEAQVVVYVREPAAYYLSRMQQSVKGSATITAPSAHRYSLHRRLSGIEAAFGEALVVRPFDAAQMEQGCVVRDFLAGLPCPQPPALEVLRRNEGLSAEACCILQRMHALALPDARSITPPAQRVAQVLAGLPDQTPARLRPGIAAQLRRMAQPELSWLRSHFGLRFSLEEPGSAEAEPPAGWDSTRFEEILAVEPARVEATLHRLVVALAS